MSEDIHALSGAYALDALDDDERAQFERHLEGCAACRAEVDELASAATELGVAAPEDPPPALRATVLAAIDQVRPLPPVASGRIEADRPTVSPLRRRRLPILAAVAAALVLLAGGVLAISRLGEDTETPTAASVLADPDARRVTEELDGFEATVVVSDAADRAVIVSDDMPPAPSGHSYQLWYDRPGQGMVSAGVMPASDDGQEVLLDGPVGDATAVGVTVEPAGGSPEPTSEPVAVIALT